MIGSAADNRPYEDSHQRRIGTAGVIHKSALSKIVAERLGISQVAAVEAAAPVVESIEQALSVNDRVTLTRFAIFSAGQRAGIAASDCRRQRRADNRCGVLYFRWFQNGKHAQTDRTLRSPIARHGCCLCLVAII